MDDLFNVGYVVFIIIIFVFSALRNVMKQRAKMQQPPPKPTRQPPGPMPPKVTPAQVLQRELERMLGFDEDKPAPPVYQPGVPKPVPIPAKAPDTFYRTEKPEPAKPIRKPSQPVDPMPYKRVEKKPIMPKPKPPIVPAFPVGSLRERIIWAEILGPPKAKRRKRTI